jgi:hypothetical protein
MQVVIEKSSSHSIISKLSLKKVVLIQSSIAMNFKSDHGSPKQMV